MSDLENQNNDVQSALSSEPVYPADTFPHKYVHSVFENRQNAELAVQALLAAGFTTDDTNFMTSQDFFQAAEQGEHQNKSLSKSLSHFVSSLDHNVTDAYINEAHRGNDILSVRIFRPDQMTQVRDILAPYHGQRIQYTALTPTEDTMLMDMACSSVSLRSNESLTTDFKQSILITTFSLRS